MTSLRSSCIEGLQEVGAFLNSSSLFSEAGDLSVDC